MLTDDEIDEIRFRIPTKAVTQRDYEVARAVEQAAYAAAIKAIKGYLIDEADVIEEIDRAVNEAIENCAELVRELMQEQPK